jgi:hypothetical protein
MLALVRTRTFGALVTGIAALAVLAPAAAAATLSAPATATIGGRVSVHASKLVPGRYRLFLAYTKPQANGGTVNCSASIGAARTVGASGTFSGTIPATLTCRRDNGTVTGTESVRAGRYDLAVYSPVGANQYNGRRSFVQRPLTITG